MTYSSSTPCTSRPRTDFHVPIDDSPLAVVVTRERVRDEHRRNQLAATLNLKLSVESLSVCMDRVMRNAKPFGHALFVIDSCQQNLQDLSLSWDSRSDVVTDLHLSLS